MTLAGIRTFSCVALAGLLAAGCREKDAKQESAKPSATERRKSKVEATLARPRGSAVELAREIGMLTGGVPARIVWGQSQNPRSPDSYSTGVSQILMGIDTSDGRGERVILQKQGNYTRPLLSTDGRTILFTRRTLSRKGHLWVTRGEIFRTDWKGTEPVRLGDGMAVDCWRDPATQVEWVYAVQEWVLSKKTASIPTRLVRFPLMDPVRMETVSDELRLDADNIQLSRDGRRASGGFPWPNAGIFILEGGEVTAKKLRNGCWPSCAPDNSRVSWVFDGSHRSATFFAGDGARSWEVKLSPPDAEHSEMFHPRWSNHPRFFAITGPYQSGKSGGGIRGTGGRSAEVYLGRFDAALQKVEAWVEVTDNDLGDNFPDLWIEGGETAQLDGFDRSEKPAGKPADPAAGWPAKMDGMLFFWRNNSAQNSWRGSDGHVHTADIENLGASRFGPRFEMLLGGGEVEMEETGARATVQHLRGGTGVTFEALVLPGASGDNGGSQAPAVSYLFRGPDFRVGLQEGRLLLARDSGDSWAGTGPLPDKTFHLAVIREADAFRALVNGNSVELTSRKSVVRGTPVEAPRFGGGWNGGLMNIAIYGRALDLGEVAENSAAMLREAAAFPPPPPQVRLRARLVESSATPALEDIVPYSGSLVALVYEVEQVLAGSFKDKRILVKHWGLLNRNPVTGFPREVGRSYELLVESESGHPEIKGERVADETTGFELEPWFDISPPNVIVQP